MINNITSITKVLLKNYFQNMPIIDKNNKINKKSIYVWAIIIIFFVLAYLCDKIINFLTYINQQVMFLNAFFLLMMILIAFQTIVLCINIFYFSDDLKYLLPFPIKPIELLISKFIVLLSPVYISEIIFGGIPLLLYGILTKSAIVYFLYAVLILMLFPILISAIISIITYVLMKILRFVKNKDIIPPIITFVVVSLLMCGIFNIIGIFLEGMDLSPDGKVSIEFITQKVIDINNILENINKNLLIISPTVKALSEVNGISPILRIIQIIIIDVVRIGLLGEFGKNHLY